MALATTTNRNYPIVDDAPTSYLDTIIIPALADLANLIDVDVQTLITGKIATTALDTDGTLAANDDAKIASQKATKTYANSVGAAAIAASQPLAARLTAIVASGIALSMFATDVADTDPTLAANSATRVATQSAVKSYVDNAVTGIFWKPICDVATTGNITLSGEQTIDGVLTSASRVLVKAQTTASQNGLYLSGAGAWTRVAEADTGFEIWGATVMVKRGTVGANTQWTNTNATQPTLGSTSITFAQISGAGTYSATGGVILTGNQFSADTGTSGHKLPWLDGANTWSDTQTLRKSGGGFQFLIDNGANTKQISSWFSSSDDQWNLQPRSAGSLVSGTALSYNFTTGRWGISDITVGSGTDTPVAGYSGLKVKVSGSTAGMTVRRDGFGEVAVMSGGYNGIGTITNHPLDILVNSAVVAQFSSSGLTMGAGTNISPGSGGQAQFTGSGYTGFVAMNGTAMYLGHNSGSRNIVLRIGSENLLTAMPGGIVTVGTGSSVAQNGDLRIDGHASYATVLRFQKAGINHWFIGRNISSVNDHFEITDGAGAQKMRIDSSTHYLWCSGIVPRADNALQNGDPSLRWTAIYAVNGTIQTSDMREKTEFTSVNDNERAFIRDVFMGAGWYNWLDAVDKKGDRARDHFGLGAQNVEALARKHGMDPNAKAFFCEDAINEHVEVKGREVTRPVMKGGKQYVRKGLRPDQLHTLGIAALFKEVADLRAELNQLRKAA